MMSCENPSQTFDLSESVYPDTEVMMMMNQSKFIHFNICRLNLAVVEHKQHSLYVKIVVKQVDVLITSTKLNSIENFG